LLDALSSQSARDSIEVVLMDLGAANGSLRMPEGLATRVLARPPGTGLGEARAEATRVARGEVIASIEEHCYPEPGWAEALIAAYRDGWGAVGYSFRNANPHTYASRAVFLSQYAWWTSSARGGRAHTLPNLNVSYRRELLLEFGDALAELLEIDFGLQEVLRRRGVRMAVEPRAVAMHENEESFRAAGQAGGQYSRLLAARRVKQDRWGILHRLLYTLVTPVFAPMLRVGRLLLNARRNPGQLREVLVCLPGIFVVAGISALGEAWGYLLGEGDSLAGYRSVELEAVRAHRG
jgi:hypothetical protein